MRFIKIILFTVILAPALLPRAYCYTTGVLPHGRLIAQTERNLVMGRVGTEALSREFLALWEALLKRAGRVNLKPSYVAGIVSIKYESPDNLTLRSFRFTRDVLPGDPRENIGVLSAALEESGLRVAGAFAVEQGSGTPLSDGVIYYLTGAEDAEDSEIRLRYLKFPDPEVRISGALVEKSGVRIALRQGPGAIFYIGRRLGIHVLKADSPEKAAAQARHYRNLLKIGKEKYIGMETDILDTGGDTSRFITKIFTYISGGG